jgi:ABC-2 type transport system permease protein
LLSTPIKRWEIVTGYLLGFGLFTIVQSFVIVTYCVYVLDIWMAGDFWQLSVVTFLLAITALTLATLLSAFTNKTKKDLLISIVSPMIMKFAVPFFAEKFINEVFQDERLDNFEDLLRKLMYNRYQFVKNNASLLKIILQEMAFHTEIQEKFRAVFTKTILPQFKSCRSF